MFQLSTEETENLKSQFATSSGGHGGRRYRPYAFTEHGAVMLASVLNSKIAVEIVAQRFSSAALPPITTKSRGPAKQSLMSLRDTPKDESDPSPDLILRPPSALGRGKKFESIPLRRGGGGGHAPPGEGSLFGAGLPCFPALRFEGERPSNAPVRYGELCDRFRGTNEVHQVAAQR